LLADDVSPARLNECRHALTKIEDQNNLLLMPGPLSVH
jgi:hypothetical protein